MRRTKIVVTAGPATDPPGLMDALVAEGADVVRLNAAHAGPGELGERLRMVRSAEERAGRHVAILVDLAGPKLRVGEVAPGVVLQTGATFRLLAEECVGDASRVGVSHPGLAEDLSKGDRVLLDDGLIELEVVSASRGEVVTTVLTGGPLLSHKGINVPGVRLSVEPLTRYDRTVLAWAQANDVDLVGLSFVRSAADVDAARELMTRRVVPIVAKIEKAEAVGDIEAILATADAVMVARGDLGVEMRPEDVPLAQRRIVAAARRAGKPVIIATQMLDSMTHSRRPTRAEASDVANAIFGRADAVMLSAETAVGEHPLDAFRTMLRIAETSEGEVAGMGWDHVAEEGVDVQRAVSAAVCDLASDLRLAAIVPVTESGATARAVARHRPDAPVVAATPDPSVSRRLALVWGVRSVVVAFAENTDELLDAAVAALVAEGHARQGERIAITAGRAARTPGGTDFILVREV